MCEWVRQCQLGGGLTADARAAAAELVSGFSGDTAMGVNWSSDRLVEACFSKVARIVIGKVTVSATAENGKSIKNMIPNTFLKSAISRA
jgi:hypothetical protein